MDPKLILKHLDAIDATIGVLEVQSQTIRHLLLASPEAPRETPAPKIDERPERCRQVPQAFCGLVTDDEDARLDISTLGGDAWKCNGCGYRSDHNE